MKKVMKILYDELEKDLIELMHEATPMNLNSLINTIRDCEDVETVKIKRFYLKGDIHADDRKSIYNNSYLEVIDDNDDEIGTIWFGRIDWLSPERERYRDGTPIEEDTKLYVDIKNDIVNIISVDREDTCEENAILFYELFKELK